MNPPSSWSLQFTSPEGQHNRIYRVKGLARGLARGVVRGSDARGVVGGVVGGVARVLGLSIRG
jgi:hypothetical protein